MSVVDDNYTSFKPNIPAIEAIVASDVRAYAIVGAIVLTASAIDMALLDIALKLLPLKQTTTAKIFNKMHHLTLVDGLIDEATAKEKADWSALRVRIEEAVNGPRHLGAHGHLEVRPIFQFVGVPGPAGTLASTGFDVIGISATLQQHPALVDLLNKKPMPFTPEEMLDHCRRQAQVLADIRNFAARLECSR